MAWWAWLILTLVGVLGIWGAISPRSQWNTLSAWQYRNPDANEPSDAAYALTRIVNVIGLIALVIMFVLLIASGVGVSA